MIAFVRGRVVDKRPDSAVLDVGGVGYEVAMPTGSLAALPGEGQEATVMTYLHVRDDGVSLFGFASDEEKALFEALIGVSGVGPKVALAALSALAPATLRQAIASEDVATVASTPGIGKKTAQRIIVELKDKVGVPEVSVAADVPPEPLGEAVEALTQMGFSRREVMRALSDFEGDGEQAEALVRHALKRLGGSV
ncbi:MAG: Holliday junction branch migration protein RuvA [Coriobacteriia bacterium]